MTTQYVLVELGNWLSSVGDRATYVSLLENIHADRHTLVQDAVPDLFQRGFELFARRDDKEWSRTDCTSLIVITERGLTEVLSADHHFQQAGFEILLR